MCRGSEYIGYDAGGGSWVIQDSSKTMIIQNFVVFVVRIHARDIVFQYGLICKIVYNIN